MSNSEEKEETDFLIDGLLYLILGLICILVIVGYPFFQWKENRADYYATNPDIVPGAELLFGLLIFFPILILGFYLGVKGMGDLITALRLISTSDDELSVN